MKRFLQVVLQLLSSYLSTALAYRASFLQSALASLMWSAFSFVSAYLVTTQTPSVAGMDRPNLLLLAATYGIVVGTHHWLCSRGFAGFAETVHKGELDGYLLRPFDTLTFLSLRNIAWTSFPRIIGSIFVTTFLVQTYNFPVTPLTVLSFVAMTFVSFFLIYSLYCIACTVLIWHSYLSNIYDLIQFAVGSGRYPLTIVKYVPLAAVAVYVPFLLITNVPTQALIGNLSLQQAGMYMALVATVFGFSRWFWKFALRHYTGASA